MFGSLQPFLHHPPEHMEPDIPDGSKSIQALLANLRSSSAWAQVTAEQQIPNHGISRSLEIKSTDPRPRVPHSAPEGGSPTSKPAPNNESGVSSQISSLLALLHPGSASGADPLPHQSPPEAAPIPPASQEAVHVLDSFMDAPLSHPDPPPVDLRNLSFQRSLGHISRILDDPTALGKLRSMKQEQEDIEQKLWKGRTEVVAKHEEKIKVARNTARIVTGSTDLNAHEIRRLNEELDRDLIKYDQQRFLPAWDRLVEKQQQALEGLGVPGMFVTRVSGDRDKQQRIMGVVEDGMQDGMS